MKRLLYYKGPVGSENYEAPDKNSYVVTVLKFGGPDLSGFSVCLASAIKLQHQNKNPDGTYRYAGVNTAFARHIKSVKKLIDTFKTPSLAVVAHGIKSKFEDKRAKKALLSHIEHMDASLEVQSQTFGFAVADDIPSQADFCVAKLPVDLLVCKPEEVDLVASQTVEPKRADQKKIVYFIKATDSDTSSPAAVLYKFNLEEATSLWQGS